MMQGADFVLLIIGMTVASFACRAGGYWFMGLIPISPRLEAALKATPLAVMVGIATPAAASGQPPEIMGLLAAGSLMYLTRNDLVGAVGGVLAVALTRLALS